MDLSDEQIFHAPPDGIDEPRTYGKKEKTCPSDARESIRSIGCKQPRYPPAIFGYKKKILGQNRFELQWEILQQTRQ